MLQWLSNYFFQLITIPDVRRHFNFSEYPFYRGDLNSSRIVFLLSSFRNKYIISSSGGKIIANFPPEDEIIYLFRKLESKKTIFEEFKSPIQNTWCVANRITSKYNSDDENGTAISTQEFDCRAEEGLYTGSRPHISPANLRKMVNRMRVQGKRYR